MKKVSIIIVTYNSFHLISDCISSIFDNNDIGDALDVIVADNASSDQFEVFKLIEEKFKGKKIRCFDTGENAGYGKGNNFGVKKTDADIVIVMNPDVRFVRPVLKKIVNAFNDQNLGMAGVNFIDGSNPYYFKPEYYNFFRLVFIHQYIRRGKYDSQKMYMSGSLLIFDRKSFIEAGMFDENIFMYYEEPDITNRVLSIGKDVKWLKEIMVLHLAHGRNYNQKLTDIGYESLEYYCNKYGFKAKRIYQIYLRVLGLKVFLAKIVGDEGRIDNLKKSFDSLRKHIKTL